MRLIDADELDIYDVSPAYGMCVMGVTQEDIDDAPTVDAEPVRHGHWIRKFDTRFGPKLNDIIICSNCNIAFSTEDMFRRSYCPSCGAKMDGEEE